MGYILKNQELQKEPDELSNGDFKKHPAVEGWDWSPFQSKQNTMTWDWSPFQNKQNAMTWVDNTAKSSPPNSPNAWEK